MGRRLSRRCPAKDRNRIGTGQGGDEAVSTEDDDPSIEFALPIARKLAAAKGETNIDILDPDGS